ncbi:hypothetical protein WJX73_000801 [Symbiochloris irregularis]|uniref:Uncharacterized protein n=1 Tax=Symbiochloris irregularis TaxID=706552 RepID=A0AAW1P8I0_9CHLO
MLLKQFYVAVGTPEAKLPTLAELVSYLALASPSKPFGAAVLCNSRDALDSVATELSIPANKLYIMHTDLELDDRLQLAKSLNQAISGAAGQDQQNSGRQAQIAESGAGWSAAEQHQHPAHASGTATSGPDTTVTGHILVATDACFRSPEASAAFPAVSVLINSDLPARKEMLARRASLVSEFREVEQHSAALGLGAIEVMPVHIPDLFL